MAYLLTLKLHIMAFTGNASATGNLIGNLQGCRNRKLVYRGFTFSQLGSRIRKCFYRDFKPSICDVRSVYHTKCIFLPSTETKVVASCSGDIFWWNRHPCGHFFSTSGWIRISRTWCENVVWGLEGKRKM